MKKRKRIFNSIILAICFIGICYLYQFVRIHQQIIVIADVLSFLSLVFIGFSLKETIKQRTISYRPKILILQRSQFLQVSKKGTPAIWKDSIKDYYLTHSNETTYMASIAIYNAGIGPAITLSLEWSFERKGIINFLIETSNKYPDHFAFNQDDKILKVFQQDSLNKSTSFTYKLFQDDEKNNINISNIPPYSAMDEFYIALPESFVVFLSIFSYVNVVLKKNEHVDVPFPLKYKLKFYDTGEKQYKDTKKIQFSFENITGLVSFDDQPFERSVNYAICNFKTIE